MADISKLEQQADLLMQNVSGWETSTLERLGKTVFITREEAEQALKGGVQE